MLIQTINSGSDGNAYVLRVDKQILLIECGVPSREMLKTISFDTLNVVGCLVSHEHS